MSKIKTIIGNQKTEKIALSGIAIIIPSLIFSGFALSPEKPDDTGSENRVVVKQAFNKTAKHLTQLLPELKQGHSASTNIATMETLAKLKKLGTNIPDTITNQRDNTVKQARLEKELAIFIDALALDSDLTETDKYELLNQLKVKNILPEKSAAFNASAGYLDECRIDNTTANNIYKCSKTLNNADTDTFISAMVPLFVLIFTLLGLGMTSENYRKYAKEGSKIKNKKLGHDH